MNFKLTKRNLSSGQVFGVQGRENLLKRLNLRDPQTRSPRDKAREGEKS